MSEDLLGRLEQTAHDFELHNPSKGVTYRGRCDVEAIRLAVIEIKRLRAALAPDPRLASFPNTAPDLVHPSAVNPQDVKENDNG